jgi:hypothetical protein
MEEFQRLIESPNETLESIGLRPIPGLEAESIPYITLARPGNAYSHS